MAAKKSTQKSVKKKATRKRAAKKHTTTKSVEHREPDNAPDVLTMPEDADPSLETTPGTGVRRTIYTQEVGEQIALAIATTLVPIHTLCKLENWPSVYTLYRWEAREAEFHALLWHARRARADHMASKGLEDLEDVKPDSQFGAARVAHAKALSVVRLAIAKRLSPDWVEKTAHTVTGPITPEGEATPVDLHIIDATERARRVQAILDEVDKGATQD